MRVLAEEKWGWMLFEDQQGKYLSVVCGAVGIFNINIPLAQSEVANFMSHGNSYLALLACEVAKQPANSQSRSLPNLDAMPEVCKAVTVWRELHSAKF